MVKKTKKDISNEDLARMVAGGFSDMNKKFDRIDQRFEGVDQKFVDLESSLTQKIVDVEASLTHKINGLSNRIDDLALNRTTREEMKILSLRVENIEHKIGIKK